VERSKWTEDPFGGVVKDGFLYGRGSSDDKGQVAGMLEVFLLLNRAKPPLDRDIILLMEAGEEGTTRWGIDYMVVNHWKQIEAEYALNEGGTVHQDEPGGKVAWVGIATTEKVPRGLKVAAHGSSGHGSMPRLDNAITHVAAAVGKIGAWQPPMRLNDTTRTFFAGLAKVSPPDKAALYSHLEDEKTQETLRASDISANSMLRTSITPTIIKGGFRENVIPAEAEAFLDVRALPDEDMPALVATLTKLVNDPEVKIAPGGEQTRPITPPSSLDSDMFHALERAQQKVFPSIVTLPMMLTGATDSAQLRAKGVQAYGVGPPASPVERARVHGNDERLWVEGLGKFVELIYTAVADVAGAK
jgi:acetylornithine deacetylase/succinyl-diaminopimelate desuccinylase-like protein